MTEEQKAELHRLEKLTVTKLRDEAIQKYHDQLVGVHGMTKEEIISEVCKLQGIPYEETTHKIAKGIDKTKSKQQIKTIHTQLLEQGKSKRERQILRTKVKRLKRSLRRAA
ncbi:MAG: hypothetical protein HZA78_03460 [Candidatus Schekmanbacteria bacterium]|nr:hypothetical protein [Candidatus Schekmanbacteria bacterium]